MQAKAAESGGTVAIGASAVSNIFLGATLSQLWSLVNGLQIIVHLPLFNSKFPSNAEEFMSGLIFIATFEFLPESYVYIFTDYPDRGAYSEKLEMTKYESTFPLQNMPTDFLIFQILFVSYIL